MSDGNEHMLNAMEKMEQLIPQNMVEGLNFKNQIIRGNYVFNKKSDEQKISMQHLRSQMQQLGNLMLL